MLAINDHADGVTEIAQEVPAISDLDRLRNTLTYTVGVSTGPVACDLPADDPLYEALMMISAWRSVCEAAGGGATGGPLRQGPAKSRRR